MMIYFKSFEEIVTIQQKIIEIFEKLEGLFSEMNSKCYRTLIYFITF
ncbi:hypothetical protein SAMN06298216_4276 [Spirosomataceae bacterium TFI 002]|nr:hypothetical protein SAMN06298216_4276 [Spirosomataceae bacterium TFI 002]